MKHFLLSVIGVVLFSVFVSAQITTPIIKAGFGVDADLRANYFNGFVQSGNDDWFNNGTAGTGNFVIDTTGAAAVVAGYLSDVSPWPRRMTPIYRSMSRPKFSVVNNRIWLDALFIRDHHGNDSTVFVISDKNGDSPADWTGGIQSVPDKNDILDVFMHIRRAGPTTLDSLWMFGGLSLDNTTGNRYFDFEMYQTDIYYDQPTQRFYGYGPDAGHTSWVLDPATGNILKAGDIIFSAEYQSSTLTNIEARIWIDKAMLSITPSQFVWGGQFDGATTGSQYGYASIMPKAAGAYYTGLGSGTNTWAGPFQLVLQDNSLSTTYGKDQFMEFSVNLTKLGLDPVTSFGGDLCGTPFNRLIVKTRASASFTAQLKDFIAPIDLFLAPRANLAAEVPIFCGIADTITSVVAVQNPHPTSVYTWSTPNGNIFYTAPDGTWIQVNQPGTYIVTQRLLAGCNTYATDTISIIRDSTCNILAARFSSFSGTYLASNKKAELKWTVLNNSLARSFVVEVSNDGGNFIETGMVFAKTDLPDEASYNFNYNVPVTISSYMDFRIKMINDDGTYSYSRVLRINAKQLIKPGITIAPNPVREKFQIAINSTSDTQAKILIFDMQGRSVMVMNETLKKGMNVFSVDIAAAWQPGIYNALVEINKETFTSRFVVLE